MAAHALVIGCDAYPHQPGGDLRGAVRDALSFRDWLLDTDVGGGVAEADLVLLVSPSAGGAQPVCSTAGAVTRREVAATVRQFVDRTDVGPQDLLYVYFAGHGLRSDPNNPQLARDVLATTDFSPDDPPGGSVAVLDLITRLEQSGYGYLVVLLDACRNFPFRTAFEVGGLGRDPEPRPARHREPRLFRMHGTHVGGTAQGSATEGAMRGDFTVALLDGLAGVGAAKRFDETADPPYQVTWHSLVAYVEARLPQLGPLGREGGELILAAFPDDWFDEIPLTVEVEPAATSGSEALEIRVSHVSPSAFEDPVIHRPGPAPVAFQVPPRRQRVRAQAGDLWGTRIVDVYEELLVTVSLAAGGPPRRSLPPGEDVVRGPGDRPGAMHVRCDDPAALLDVQAPGGASMLSGLGEIQGELAAGAYTVLMTGALARTESVPVEVEAGYETVVSPDPQTPRRTVSQGDDDARVLRWASDAAVVAARAAASELDPAGELFSSAASPVVVVVGEGAATHGWAQSNFDPPSLVEAKVIAFGAQQLRRFEPNTDHWFILDVRGHPVVVPAHPAAVTAVVLDDAGVSVAVFDRSTLEDPLATLLVDRAQLLLGLGMPESARQLLDKASQQRMAGLVSHLLYRAARGDLQRGEQGESSTLAAARPVADAAYALAIGPWASFVDYPRLNELRHPAAEHVDPDHYRSLLTGPSAVQIRNEEDDGPEPELLLRN